MSITPIPLSSLKKGKLSDPNSFSYDLYECSYLLRVKRFEEKDSDAHQNDVDIVMSSIYEGTNKFLLVLVCSNGSLLLHLQESAEKPVMKQLNWFQNPSKRILALCLDPIHGSWILCVCADGNSLYLIPVLSQLKDSNKIVKPSSMWSETDLSRVPFTKPLKGIPTSIVWWHTLDDRNIGIIATELGEIVFVDISQHQEIGRAIIKEQIVRLEILQDINAHYTHLYIFTKTNLTIQLLLEQPSQSTDFNPPSSLTQGHDMGYDMVSDCNIDSILATNNTNKDEININGRIEILPQDFQYSIHTLDDRLFIGKYDMKYQAFEVFSDIKRVPEYVYHLNTIHSNRIILCKDFMFTTDTNSDGVVINLLSRQLCATSFNRQGLKKLDPSRRTEIQKFNLLKNEEILDCYTTTFHRPAKWNKLFPYNKGYNDTRELSSFLIVTKAGLLQCRPRTPPESYFTDLALKHGLEVAERIGVTLDLNISLLCEYMADMLISSKDIQNAVKFYNLSKCLASKRALKLVEFSSVTDGLIFIKQILKKQPVYLSAKERKQLSNMAILCYVEQVLENQKSGTFSKNLADSFRSFISDNFDYDEQIAMDLLVSYGMVDNLFQVAKTRGRIDDALEKLSSRGLFLLTKPVQDMLLDRGYADLLCKASNGVFIKHMHPEEAAKFLLAQPNLTKSFIVLLSGMLLKFEETTLLQIARVFDPSRQFIKPILERSESMKRKRTGSCYSLSSMASSSSIDDPSIPTTQEIIVMFLKTVIALNSKRKNCELPNLKLISRHLSGQSSWSGSIYMREKGTSQDFDVNNQSDSLGSNELLVSEMARVKLACGNHHTAFVTSEKELYTWGRASFGRLGQGDLIEERATCPPMRVESLHMHGIQVLSVACGAFHTVVLCQEGVFSWGQNKYGQLGIGDKRKRSRPVLISELSSKQINSVVCGQYHTLAVTNDFKVYAWGWGVHGQLGLESVENQVTPQPIVFLLEHRVIQVSAGHSHSAALTSKGQVYTFGSGLYGQLGIGVNTKKTVPQHVSSLLADNIYIIACGAFETLAVSDEQTIYCWGRNHHQFHICGKAESASYGRQMASNTTDIRHRFLPEDLPFKLQQPIIQEKGTSQDVDVKNQLLCGNWHYMALTSMNYVYTWGCNDCGQLGHYNKMEQPAPRLVKALSRRTITGIGAGSEFSLAVDSEDQILAWGRADGGLIGIENDNVPTSPVARRSIFSVLAPTVVPGLPIHFDQVSIDSMQSIKRDFVFDQNYDLPDLSSVGHDHAPYSCEAVLLALYKLTGLYNVDVLTQKLVSSILLWNTNMWRSTGIGCYLKTSTSKFRYALHTEQWFVLSFCYELQEKWDQAFYYRAKSIKNHYVRTGELHSYSEKIVMVVKDLLNKFEDNLAEDYEKDSSIVAMVSCLCLIFQLWIDENLLFQRLEDILRKHMESLCPLYTIVFFGFLSDATAVPQVSLRFALYKTRKQPEAARFLSKSFFLHFLTQVTNQMESGSNWYTFLSSDSSSLESNQEKDVINLSVPVEESTLSRDEMLKEIVEHKQKVLSVKSFISLSNAVATTLAAASTAHRAESYNTPSYDFLPAANEFSTMTEDHGSMKKQRNRYDSTVFSCYHNLPRYYMLETVIPEFQSRMAELPEPLVHTAEVMAKFYKQCESRIPLACPYCVYNNLRNEQLQLLRESGADLINDRSSLWEI